MVQRALVLSGGGAKGIYQVGCLKKLLEGDGAPDFDFLTTYALASLAAATTTAALTRPASAFESPRPVVPEFSR